ARSSTSPTEKGWKWLKSEMARTTGRVPPGVAASFQESSQRRSSGSAVRKPASTWLSVSEETKRPYDAHTSEKRTSPRYPATSDQVDERRAEVGAQLLAEERDEAPHALAPGPAGPVARRPDQLDEEILQAGRAGAHLEEGPAARHQRGAERALHGPGIARRKCEGRAREPVRRAALHPHDPRQRGELGRDRVGWPVHAQHEPRHPRQALRQP